MLSVCVSALYTFLYEDCQNKKHKVVINVNKFRTHTLFLFRYTNPITFWVEFELFSSAFWKNALFAHVYIVQYKIKQYDRTAIHPIWHKNMPNRRPCTISVYFFRLWFIYGLRVWVYTFFLYSSSPFDWRYFNDAWMWYFFFLK